MHFFYSNAFLIKTMDIGTQTEISNTHYYKKSYIYTVTTLHKNVPGIYVGQTSQK